MPYKVLFDEECQCIMVVVTEQLDLPLLQKMAKDVAKIVQETGVGIVLNDLRNAKPTPKIIDVYNMPQTAKKAGVSQFYKRALVVGDRSEEFHFLETVFINQGHQVRMFAEIEDAEKWLFGE
jgi:hypothetical protein